MAKFRSESDINNELGIKFQQSRTKWSILASIVFVVLSIVFCISTIGLLFLLIRSSGPSNEVNFTSQSYMGKFKKAAVVTESSLCAEAGRNVLLAGGNAPEAAIATILCIGVVHPHFSGLGGGFLMTIYNRTTQKCSAIDAREVAPFRADPHMYVNDTEQSVYGYRAVAVPAELHGMWSVFRRFGSGRIAWSRLFDEAIRLARDGYPFPSHLNHSALPEKTKTAPLMKDLLYNPKTGKFFVEGDIIKRPTLARTLERLAQAEDPVELFYRGEMAQDIAKEFEANDGLIDLESLANYSTKIHEKALEVDFTDDLKICGPPLPSSFVVTQSIIRVVNEFYKNKKVGLEDAEVQHRIIEAQKFAYSQRAKMGDIPFANGSKELMEQMLEENYIQQVMRRVRSKAQPLKYYTDVLTDIRLDHGTSSLSIIDEDGNAVTMTSTTNTKYSSRMVSPILGIPWNNQMDDFSTPGLTNFYGFVPSEANFIAPGKRPMSSMSPIIIYGEKSGKVRLAAGASGGMYIISSVAQTAIRALTFNQSIKEAVDGPRFHNMFTEETKYEETVPEKIATQLTSQYGQKMTKVARVSASVSAFKVEDDDFIYAVSDYRKSDRITPSGY